MYCGLYYRLDAKTMSWRDRHYQRQRSVLFLWSLCIPHSDMRQYINIGEQKSIKKSLSIEISKGQLSFTNFAAFLDQPLCHSTKQCRAKQKKPFKVINVYIGQNYNNKYIFWLRNLWLVNFDKKLEAGLKMISIIFQTILFFFFSLLFSKACGVLEEGWIEFEDACYAYVDKPFTYQQARTYCQGFLGRTADLVFDMNANANIYTLNLVMNKTAFKRTGKLWIGLEVLDANESRWIKNNFNSYRNWIYGHRPKYLRGTCTVMLNNGQWTDSGCFERLPFVCMKGIIIILYELFIEITNIVRTFE